MRVGDYVLSRLQAAGCTTVFGIFGAANGPLVDGFHRTPGLRYVSMQHEQAAAFAAEGYAKTATRSNAFGTCLATSGPGGQNLVTGVANAFYDSTPVFFLTGQVNTAFMRPSREVRQTGFQETPITDIVAPITKAAVLIKNPEDIRWVMDMLLATMLGGRPGPVLLDIPLNIQKAEIDPEKLSGYRANLSVVANQGVVQWAERVVEALLAAARPGLLVGGGCRGLDVWTFARDLGVPAYPTWNALDLVPSDHPFYGGRIGTYGGPGYNRGIQDTDVLVGIGCRVSGRITGGQPASFAPRARRFFADCDPAVLAHLPFDADTVVSDAGTAFSAIRAAIAQHPQPSWDAWVSRNRAGVAELDPVRPRYWNTPEVHPYVFARVFGDLIHADSVVVPDCGGNLVVFNHAMKTRRGMRFFSSNGNSPMGFSLSAAIGSVYASEGRPVFCVTGDGGMQVNIQELQTIKHNNLPVKIIILNNHRYGITSQYQRTNFENRQIGNGTVLNEGDYSVPDFCEIAKAYGIMARSVCRRNEEIRGHVEWLRDLKGPGLLVVDCPGFDTYLPRISRGDLPIDQMELPE